MDHRLLSLAEPQDRTWTETIIAYAGLIELSRLDPYAVDRQTVFGNFGGCAARGEKSRSEAERACEINGKHGISFMGAERTASGAALA
jgi:hypothetical protein